MSSNILTDVIRLGQWDNGNAVTNLPVNFASDPINAILETTTGDAIADNSKRGVTFENDATNGPTAAGNEVSGTGYTARGQALTSLSMTQTSHVATFTSANPSWTASTITAFGVWLVKHEATAGASPAIGYWTFGGAVSSSAGTFSVTVNASGWFTVSGG